MLGKYIILAALILFVAGSSAGAQLIVDTDMGLDDVRSVFALVAGDRQIGAFITAGGSTAPGKGADNLIGLLEAAGCREASVIVGTGNPAAEPPPWRETASRLAGENFPPPRYIRASHGGVEELRHIVTEHMGKAEYLALGPLTNLHGLISGTGGLPEGLERVWIPAGSVSPEGEVDAWNLQYDEEAAEKVLNSGLEIILVDVSGMGEDGRNIFSLAGPETPAGRWIGAVAESAGEHVGLYDEVAAAAVINAKLFSIGRRSYSVELVDHVIRLKEDSSGGIKIATAAKPDRVGELLIHYWQEGGCKGGGGHHHNQAAIRPLNLMKTFHGHLGPWVVIGYRAGKAALGLLKSSGHFGVSATVSAPAHPPVSCFIDGVQLGSGCTLGKRNITAGVSEGPPVVEFVREGGRGVRIAIPESTMDMVERLVNEYGVEEAGRMVWEKKQISLFRAEFIDN